MKDFVIKKLDDFLRIADNIDTVFKFYQVEEISADKVSVEVKIWLRTAYISYETELPKDQLEDFRKRMEDHGFVDSELRETPIIIK